jgi:hypothetical protein
MKDTLDWDATEIKQWEFDRPVLKLRFVCKNTRDKYPPCQRLSAPLMHRYFAGHHLCALRRLRCSSCCNRTSPQTSYPLPTWPCPISSLNLKRLLLFISIHLDSTLLLRIHPFVPIGSGCRRFRLLTSRIQRERTLGSRRYIVHSRPLCRRRSVLRRGLWL